ncbi:MAG TPA: biotin-dependent carboxyltransferase family protein, partial [Chitinophagaceae bacterium]|nr:biotin-dependent carboxyltransferase family protein [Chitinophagaceae bacterium]
MGIIIIKAGLLDTIQDLGRPSHQHEGINPGGAMDTYSMKVANILAGNDPAEAVIEMHFPASAYLFTQPAIIALAGADFSASINGEAVPHLHPILVNRNDVLQFHQPLEGARCYLAVKGGFVTDEWLGSRSTHLKAGIGGFEGRKLQKNDELMIRQTSFAFQLNESGYRVLPWRAQIKWQEDINGLLVITGHEWDRLTQEGKENFSMTSFVVTRQSDRMGYRLNNLPLPVLTHEEVLSSAVSFGTVQLLPDG